MLTKRTWVNATSQGSISFGRSKWEISLHFRGSFLRLLRPSSVLARIMFSFPAVFSFRAHTLRKASLLPVQSDRNVYEFGMCKKSSRANCNRVFDSRKEHLSNRSSAIQSIRATPGPRRRARKLTYMESVKMRSYIYIYILAFWYYKKKVHIKNAESGVTINRDR